MTPFCTRWQAENLSCARLQAMKKLDFLDRAEKRLRMLEISISKSFDRPFVWRHASLISRSILAILASCHDLKVFSVV